ANRALIISKQLRDSSLILHSYKNLGEILNIKRKNKTAKKYIEKAIALAKTLKKDNNLARLYNLLGDVERRNNNYTIALQHYEYAFKIANKYGFQKEMGAINNNLVRLYWTTANKVKAKQTLKRNIIDAKKKKNTVVLANAYNILGNTYLEKNIDSSLYFFNKADVLARKVNNAYLKSVIASNLGYVYLNLEKYKKALQYLHESEKMAIKIGDNVSLHHINISLGAYYEHKDNLKEAIKKYTKAIDTYGSFVDDYQMINTLWTISGIFEHTGNYKNANKYLHNFIKLNDSILSLEKKKEFEDIRTQYEVDKKNDEIELLEKGEKLANQQIVILIISTLGLLIFVLFYRHRIKVQKIIQKQKDQLFEKEKEALEREQEFKRIQGAIEGEEKEKNRISKELHDGIGGKLIGIRHLLQASDIPNAKTETITDNLSSVTAEIRTLSHHLSSHYIINTPFENLLTDLKNQYKYSQSFTIDIAIFPKDCFDRLSQEIKHQLYRILQELLNNIVRYAKANYISISFVRHKNNYACTVEDDGVGFDIEKQQDGIGLMNIKERIRNLHGTIEIHSLKDKGTTVAMEIPC
ncbi:MAG: tetratricopeptide repeat-containing sensor histidine kinase, partial [Polaribacter sp.]